LRPFEGGVAGGKGKEKGQGGCENSTDTTNMEWNSRNKKPSRNRYTCLSDRRERGGGEKKTKEKRSGGV